MWVIAWNQIKQLYTIPKSIKSSCCKHNSVYTLGETQYLYMMQRMCTCDLMFPRKKTKNGKRTRKICEIRKHDSDESII